MSTYQMTTDTRNLPDFRYLYLCDSANWVDLVITSGEREELTIKGPTSLVARVRTSVEHDTLIISLGGSLWDKIRDAMTTSLTRKKITYLLTVSQLEGIELCGLIRLDTSELDSEKPVIRQVNPWVIPMRFPVPPGKSPHPSRHVQR
jgi:hypothetical protein